MAEKPKTIVKVAKYRILKPAGDMTWSELGQMLRDVRYRVYRLANLAASEAYLNFQIKRQDRTSEYKIAKIGELSERLSDMLKQEGFDDKEIKKFSRKGALPAYVYSPLHMYKIRAIKWKEVLSGRCSLPTFRNNISIPIRCDQPIHRRLEMADSGNVEVDLMICRVPYPRVVLATAALDDSQKSILNRLLDNKTGHPDKKVVSFSNV